MTEEKFEQKRRTCSRCDRISTGIEFRSYDDMYWQCNACGRASLLASYEPEERKVIEGGSAEEAFSSRDATSLEYITQTVYYLEQGVRDCPYCGKRELRFRYAQRLNQVWQCSNCRRGHLFAKPEEQVKPDHAFLMPASSFENAVQFSTDEAAQASSFRLSEEDVLRLTNDRYADVKREVEHLCTALGLDLENPNFKETPRRVATWLLEKFPQSNTIQVQIDKLAQSVFPSQYDEMVVQTGIRVNGLCPHHFKDVTYDVSVGYLPAGHTIGLSKLSRAAILILSQAGTQEDLTMQLAVALSKMLKVEDVAVVARAQHGCMTCRGIRMGDSRTTTSAMRGKFTHDENGTKSEFFSIIRSSK